MQKKLSKHFIYNWLQEDAFGEVLLRSNSKLSYKISEKVLDQKNFRKLINKFSPLGRIRLSRPVEFSLLNLKKLQLENFLISGYPALRPFIKSNNYTSLLSNSLLSADTEASEKIQKFSIIQTLFNYYRYFDHHTLRSWPPSVRRRSNRNISFSPIANLCLSMRRATDISSLPVLANSQMMVNKWNTSHLSWDSLMSRLKRSTKRFERAKLASSNSNYFATRLTWKFASSSKLAVRVVKKNEIPEILKFRLLNYLGFVNNQKELKTFYPALVPNINFLDLSVLALVLRSGFFENGYVLNSLIKRNSTGLLRNGFPVHANIICKPWDVLSVSVGLWWMVYSRFYNFFMNLGITRPSLSSRGMLRRLLQVRSLFKRSTQRTTKTGLIGSKNIVLAAPSRDMEVSYKLFTLVVLDSLAKTDRFFLNLTTLKCVNL